VWPIGVHRDGRKRRPATVRSQCRGHLLAPADAGTTGGMTYHKRPKDDAWREVTLSHCVRLGRHVWSYCCHCQRDVVMPPEAFAEATGVSMDEPLLLIAERMRCSRCGEKKIQLAPSPHGHP